MIRESDLVSVIIPVYNAEKTLERCIDSVLNQTYTDLEIIIVDDGSTDHSPLICDSFQEKDNRIRVFHQTNTGVSEARNRGLRQAEGTWIAWVDADDWVEPEMIGRMQEICRRENADLAVCAHMREGKEKVRRGISEKRIFTGRKTQKLLLEDREVFSYLWDKLYRRDLFQDIVFPKDRKFEDQTVLFRVIDKAERVVCIPDCYYHYVDTVGSTVHTYTLRNAIDYYCAVRENYSDSELLGKEFSDIAAQNILRAIVPVWAFASVSEKKDPVYGKFLDVFPEMIRFVRCHRRMIKDNERIGLLGKLILCSVVLLRKKSLICMRQFGKLYCRRHGNT